MTWTLERRLRPCPPPACSSSPAPRPRRPTIFRPTSVPLIEEAAEVLVISPVLTSRLHLWTNDTDRAREEADERLGIVLGDVETIGPGTDVHGDVGDEVPLTALDDAVRTFEPDHILLALRSGSDASWQESGLPDHVRESFGLPVTAIEIDEHGRVSHTAALTRSAGRRVCRAAAERGHGERGDDEQRQRPREPDLVGDEADQRRTDDEARVADRERGGERRPGRLVPAGRAEEQRDGVGDADAAQREPDHRRHDLPDHEDGAEHDRDERHARAQEQRGAEPGRQHVAAETRRSPSRARRT